MSRVTNDFFTIKKYETDFSWLYWSMTKNGYICKICELAAESGPPHKLIDKGVLLGTHPSRKLEKPIDISHLFPSTQTTDQNQFNLCGPSFVQLLAMK